MGFIAILESFIKCHAKQNCRFFLSGYLLTNFAADYRLPATDVPLKVSHECWDKLPRMHE